MGPEMEAARRVAADYEQAAQESLRKSHIRSGDVLWPAVMAVSTVPRAIVDVLIAAEHAYIRRRRVFFLLICLFVATISGAAGYAALYTRLSIDVEFAQHHNSELKATADTLRDLLASAQLRENHRSHIDDMGRLIQFAVQTLPHGSTIQDITWPCIRFYDSRNPSNFTINASYDLCVLMMPGQMAPIHLRSWLRGRGYDVVPLDSARDAPQPPSAGSQ